MVYIFGNYIECRGSEVGRSESGDALVGINVNILGSMVMKQKL